MSSIRSDIQMARMQNDASEWTGLVRAYFEQDMVEGMKAACSGAVRGVPGSDLKVMAVELIVEYLPALAARDIRFAVDAAITGAIYSKPDSALRETATSFIAGQAEALAAVDLKLAIHSADFAVKWALYNTRLSHEATEVRDRLIAHAQSIKAA